MPSVPISGPTPATSTRPVAIVVATPLAATIGSRVLLNGKASTNAAGTTLTYKWEFVQPLPIGSRVAIQGFIEVEDDLSVVAFTPDIVGEYIFNLVVNDGNYDSDPFYQQISVRSVVVPHARGIVPDGKFIWSYLRDVWKEVEGRDLFETLWSTLIQIVGSEVLKLYQADFNKSIRDVQSEVQKRWLSYAPLLELDTDSLSFFLGNVSQGRDGITEPYPFQLKGIIVNAQEFIPVEGTALPSDVGTDLTITFSLDSGNEADYRILSLNGSKDGFLLAISSFSAPTADESYASKTFYFSDRSTSWAATTAGPYSVGNYIRFVSGDNKGIYRIMTVSGTDITVDKPPPFLSDAGNPSSGPVYNPVEFTLPRVQTSTVTSLAIPYIGRETEFDSFRVGRLLTFGGKDVTAPGGTLREAGQQTYEPSSARVDYRQGVAVAKFTIPDTNQAPSGLFGQDWRLSNTLISTSQNFDELGVNPGDLLTFKVHLVGSDVAVDLKALVVGVRKKKLAFEFTSSNLTPGSAVTENVVRTLVVGFGIDGYSLADDGTDVYEDDALDFKNSYESMLFQTSYHNVLLDQDSTLTINGKGYSFIPFSILRHQTVGVDVDLKSVPMLQEFIKPPQTVTRSGVTYQVHKGVEYALERAPRPYVENSDFTIGDENAYSGKFIFESGSNYVEGEGIDFIELGIKAGDSFEIVTPLSLAADYTISAVVSQDKIKLSLPVPLFPVDPVVEANVVITRRRSGRFMRFVPGLFSVAGPIAPKRLWAEVSFVDNNTVIEGNFGLAVGLKIDDLENVTKDITYRQAVAGLMRAYSNSPSIDNVRTGLEILLGIPFAEHRGIIRSINPDYRRDSYGRVTKGQMIVEDVDSSSDPLGTFRVYVYPLDEESELSGLEVNPVTDLPYVVGDIVEAFATLAVGIGIQDYLTHPLDDTFSAAKRLQQFHSVRVLINDNIYSSGEYDLVSKFLRNITPSYIKYALTVMSDFDEDVQALDALHMNISGEIIVDNASFGIAPALMLNNRIFLSSAGLIFIGDGVFRAMRYGLATVAATGDSKFTVSEGGILNPRATEDFEAPLVRAGDTVWIRNGMAGGKYTVDSGITDTEIPVSDGPSVGFAQESGLGYVVLRAVNPELVTGVTADISTGVDEISISGGQLRVHGVGPGDWLIVDSASVGARRFTILDVINSGSSWDTVKVTPTPTGTATPAARIWRPSLMTKVEETFQITGSGGTIYTPDDTWWIGLADPGDEIELDDDTQSRFLLGDPLDDYSVSSIPAGAADYKLVKKNRPGAFVSLDHLRYDPMEQIDIDLVEDQTLASCSVGSTDVTLQEERTTAPPSGPSAVNPATMNVKVGDYLILTGGAAGAMNIGYGNGVFPIVAFDATKVVISQGLPDTESVAWAIRRRL